MKMISRVRTADAISHLRNLSVRSFGKEHCFLKEYLLGALAAYHENVGRPTCTSYSLVYPRSDNSTKRFAHSFYQSRLSRHEISRDYRLS